MAVETKHPEYTPSRALEWQLCRDAYEGESAIKLRGAVYLPRPSGFSSAGGHQDNGEAAYSAYKMRAQFPDVMATSIGAMIGIIHDTETEIEMPDGMNFLLESADGSNTTLEDFHKRITRHLLISGRCGVLADAPMGGGEPFLAIYAAETIVNWDEGFAVLDESGFVRNGFDWQHEDRYRVLSMEDGTYSQAMYLGGAEVDVTPTKMGGGLLDYYPFVIAGSREISNSVTTPPLIGVARAALAMYQLSADRRLQLYMSGQETLVAINGDAPSAVGAGVVHEMRGTEDQTPDLKYVSPTCSGIEAHKQAIDDEKDMAVQSGARLFEQSEQRQESGEARKMRFRSETANLQTIAQSSCAALERAMRGIAVMLNLNPDDVVVTPPRDLLDATVTPQEALALWQIVKDRGLSYETFYETVKRGGIASQERDADEEFALIDSREIAEVDDL